MPEKIAALVFSFCIFFYSSASMSVLAAENPADCIEEIGIAIDASDPDTFQELVDMDNLLQKGLNAFVKEASKPENAQKLPPVANMFIRQLGLPGVAGDKLRQMLMNEMKSFTLHGIASGAFAGKAPRQTSFTGMLGPLLANASLGRKEIKKIGAPYADGADWLVPFEVHDYGNGNNYKVIGRLVNAPNGLRLAEIDNIIDLLVQIGNESIENGLAQ